MGIEVGYVCHHGHFVFNADEDNACGTKRIGTITVTPDYEGDPERFTEAVHKSECDNK